VPSISGKTIGASSFLRLEITCNAQASQSYDIWGVQLEAGSVATAFQTATGTLQGELAACQRYYYRITSNVNYGALATTGLSYSTTQLLGYIPLPVPMRIVPTAIDTSAMSTFGWDRGTIGSGTSPSSINIDASGNNFVGVVGINTSGLTANVLYRIYSNLSSSAYIGFTSEL
jgi:hypothetical protein